MNTQNETPELQKARREKTLKDGREAVKKSREVLAKAGALRRELRTVQADLDEWNEDRKASEATQSALDGVKRKKTKRIRQMI